MRVSGYFGFFLLITYKRPFRLTILQSSLRFLIEVLTFISFDNLSLLIPKCYASFG